MTPTEPAVKHHEDDSPFVAHIEEQFPDNDANVDRSDDPRFVKDIQSQFPDND